MYESDLQPIKILTLERHAIRFVTLDIDIFNSILIVYFRKNKYIVTNFHPTLKNITVIKSSNIIHDSCSTLTS